MDDDGREIAAHDGARLYVRDLSHDAGAVRACETGPPVHTKVGPRLPRCMLHATDDAQMVNETDARRVFGDFAAWMDSRGF